MDSQDRDETKIRRRQELLARRVGEALDQMKSHGAGECPDAEVVAAYAEQALAPGESAEWEGHFAACARCRNILRVLAASADAPLAEKEVAQLGKLVSAVRAPVEITAGSAGRVRPRFVDWRTRWLAPAIGVAAVLAVWFAIRPPWRVTNRGASETLVAQAPKEEVPLSAAPAEVDQSKRDVPQQDEKTAPAPAQDRLSTNAPTLKSPAGAPAKGHADAAAALDRISPGADEAKSSLQQEKKLSALPDGRELQPPAIPPSTPSPPRAQAAMEAPAAPQSGAKDASRAAAAGASQVETEANSIGNAAPRDKQAATAQGEVQSGARKERAFAVFRQMQNYSSLLKAPSGLTQWRAGSGGVIERSTDGGKTWVSQASPSQEDWLAGAAVSDTVCWVAGRNGALARTMDGQRWDRVSPPAQAAGTDSKLPDWTSITASDVQSAMVTARDGRKFATADGGKTWQLQ